MTAAQTLSDVGQMTTDALRAELRDELGPALDAQDVSDETLDRFDAVSAELGRRDERERRATAARASLQVMRRTPVGNLPAQASGEPASELMAAFTNYLRTGQANADIAHLHARGDNAVPTLRAAQSEGSGTAGGYLVPDEMAQRMTERMLAFGGLMAVAERITTSNGNNITWPDLDDTANSGEVVAEGGTAAGGADLAFTKHELGAYRFDSTGTGGLPLRVSSELVQDSMFDIVSLIERKLAERIARSMAPKWVNGTGAGEPQGLVYGLTGIELADDTAGLTYDDLITFEHSVDPAYRMLGNCRWAMNDATLAVVKKMKDSNGDPLWVRGEGVLNIGESRFGGMLNGYPVVIDQSFDDLDVDNNAQNWGAFGDFREGLVIRLVGTPVVLVDPFSRQANWETQYVAHQRADSIRNDTSAYVALTGEA